MIKQHVVDIRGNVVEAKSMEDVELMALIYNTQRTTNLPYETKKSLKQMLFEIQDVTLERQKTVIRNFFTQLGYTVLDIFSNFGTDLNISVKVNKDNIVTFVV